MKKLFLLTLFSAFLGFVALAHPPSKVNATYKDGKINIEVLHAVKDVSTHYIKSVVVFINGKEYKTFTFDKQNSEKMETFIMEIPDLKENDVVEFKATCSIFGSKTGKITIQK